MASYTPRWSRIAATCVVGAGLTLSMTAGAVSAFADPTDPASPTTPAPAPGSSGLQLSGGAAGGTPMAGGAAARPAADGAPAPAPSYATVLDRLAAEYGTGAGMGQVPVLLNQVINLRDHGIRPRPADLMAVQAAIDKRPNQGPLISALTATLAHQRKLQGQMGGGSSQQQPQGGGISINQGNDWAPGNPMIQDDPIFPMPGRN